MADEINFEVTGFGQLRQQLKEAQLEMIKLAEAGKQGSKEFIAAAQKAGQLREAIKDAAESANVFTTEGKFQAVTKSLAAVSGGFTAIQGAIGLVSDDTKAFEATFKKLQAAMALTQGLTALADLGDAFKNLGTLAVGAFRSIQAAIGSTGIGLLIVGLGSAITALALNWDELTGAIDEETKAQNEANKVMAAGTATATKQILTLGYYQRIVNDTNASEEQRLTALKELQKIVPSLTDNDLKGANALAAVNEEIKAYINNAVLKAQIDALVAKKAENLNKIQEIQAQTTEELTGGFLNSIQAYLLSSEEYDVAFQKEMMAIDSKAEATSALTKQNTALDAQLEKLTGSYIQAATVADKYATGAANAAKATKENADITGKATRERNEALRKLDEERATEGQDAITTLYANNLSRLKEAQTEELKQKDLTEAEKAAITGKYNALIKLNEQQRINAVSKLEKEAKDKREEERKKSEQDFKDSSNKEYQQTLKNLDLVIAAEETAIRQRQLTEEELQKALDDLEFRRMELRKTAAKDYVETADDAAADIIQIELDVEKKKDEIAGRTKKKEKSNLEERVAEVQKYSDAVLSAASSVTDAIQARQDLELQMQIETLKKKGLSEEQFAKEEEALQAEYFEKNKGVQVAQTIISTLSSAVSAFASLASIPVVGPALGAIAAAAALASGYYQVEQIKATTFNSSTTSASTATPPQGSMYAEGGLLTGPSHDMGGIRTSLGELEGGEFVMNRRSTANFLPLLEALNSVGNTAGPEISTNQQPVIKTYVIAGDVTTAQEANARINELARL